MAYFLKGEQYVRVSECLDEVFPFLAEVKDPAAAKAACEAGTKMHAKFEKFLRGVSCQDDPAAFLREWQPALAPAVDPEMLYLKEFITQLGPDATPVYIEKTMFHPLYHVAGTCDAIFRFRVGGIWKYCLVDWKRVWGLWEDSAARYKAQLNCYRVLATRSNLLATTENTCEMKIVCIHAESRVPGPKVYDIEEDAGTEQLFFADIGEPLWRSRKG